MTRQTNPRKVGTTAGMIYVSIPRDFLGELGLDVGDRVVLREAGEGFKAIPVQWEVQGS